MTRNIDLQRKVIININDAVREELEGVRKRSQRYGVEQDLFLCGEIKNDEAMITHFLDPINASSRAVFFYVPPERYTLEVHDTLIEVSHSLGELSRPKPEGLLARAATDILHFFLKLCVENELRSYTEKNHQSGRFKLPQGMSCFLNERGLIKPATAEKLRQIQRQTSTAHSSVTTIILFQTS